MSRRIRLQTDARRNQLLELGLQLFGNRGYEAVSIDDIAARAGVSKGLLYHYFGGKRDFYVAVVRLAAARMLAAVQPDRSLPRHLQATSALGAYLDFVDARALAYTALMQGGLAADPEIAAIIAGTRAQFVAQVLEGAEVSADRPVFHLAAASYIGAVEAASLHWLRHRQVDRATLLQLLLAQLLSALTTAAQLDPGAGLQLDPGAGLQLDPELGSGL